MSMDGFEKIVLFKATCMNHPHAKSRVDYQIYAFEPKLGRWVDRTFDVATLLGFGLQDTGGIHFENDDDDSLAGIHSKLFENGTPAPKPSNGEYAVFRHDAVRRGEFAEFLYGKLNRGDGNS